MKKDVYIISHTHWDREWYLANEVFKTKLVRLIDGILDAIDKKSNFATFLMDGQSIILEDYLEVRPENQKRLKEALENGKIICGPWYVLPDEVLISGESHIRNYLVGRDVVEKYAPINNVGYLPDSFGHPDQMPQIISGLGLKAMVFWRGVPNSIDKSEFVWYAPNKASSIVALHLPYGYGNVARLQEKDNINQRLKTMIEQLLKLSTTDTTVLMNGSDHIVAQKELGDFVEDFNNDDDDYNIIFGKMEEYVDFILPKLGELQEVEGELRSGDKSMLLGGTISTRVTLKQNNSLVERNMERYLEPLSVIASTASGKSFVEKGYLTYIWKKILENAPHDSICGCSIDQVHREMAVRFESLNNLQKEMLKQAFKTIDENSKKIESDCDAQLMIFEPTKDKMPKYVECDIELDKMLVQEVDFANSIINDYENSINHPPMPNSIVIKDKNNDNIQFVILDRRKDYHTLLTDETAPQIFKTNKIRIGMYLKEMEYGVHVLNVYNSNNRSPLNNREENKFVENQYYKIEFCADRSSFCVYDKVSKKTYYDVNKFINKGDAGDEYTYSWPQTDKEIVEFSSVSKCESITNDIFKRLIVIAEMKVPKSLTHDRKKRSTETIECEIRIELTIYNYSKRIDFIINYENRAKDNRVQVSFPSGVLVDKSKASSAFSVTTRKVELNVPDKWMEYPLNTHPTHGCISVANGNDGISVFSKGLYEYEVVNKNDQSYVNLTLLRCVGWLSRTDLLTRIGNGGWTIETPEAQCLGHYRFEYSIIFNDSNNNESHLLANGDCYKHLPMVSQTQNTVLVENTFGFLSQIDRYIRISCVKPSNDEKGIVIRLYSVSNKKSNVNFNVPSKFSSVNIVDLKEDFLYDLKIENGTVEFSIEPSQIVTLKFYLS